MASLLIPLYGFAIHATGAALRLTVKEAVAHVETAKRKRTPKRVLALPDLEQSKTPVEKNPVS
jgi:hypothetical protein